MKLWSFTVAQGGRRRVEVAGIGSGLYIPEQRLILEADPQGCEEELLAWLQDEQEALSVRYGAGTVLVVPLRSGAFGIFGPDRQLINIYKEPPTGEEFRTWSKEGYERVREAREVLQRTNPQEATAEELGL